MPPFDEPVSETLPRRIQDVLYGKIKERAEILALLDAMSRKSGQNRAADPAFIAMLDGAECPLRDPLLDHIIGLIAGCAHVPEADRVVMLDANKEPALVGLSSTERRHFGRDG